MRASRVFFAHLFSCLFALLVLSRFAFAASIWTQNSWNGGAGQNTWVDSTRFASSTNISTASANQLTLSSPTGWSDNLWKYRQSVSITNSLGSTLTDYQIPVFLDTASLISSSKLKSDCTDLRVSDATGSALSFWIATSPSANTCNQASTKIWVKLASLPAAGTNIYLYYGNTNASGQSNGGNVFPVFADFTSGSTLPTGWVKTDIGTSGNAVVGSGYLSLSNTNGGDVWVNTYGGTHAYSNSKVTGSFVAEALLTSQTNSDPWAKTGITVQNTVASGGGNGQAFIIATPGNGYDMQYQSLTGQSCTGGVCTGVIAANQNSNSGSEAFPTFLQLKKDGSNQVSGYTSSDGVSWTKRGDTVAPWGVSNDQYVTLMATPHNISGTSTATYTFFFLRKFATTEPTIGSPASEQTAFVSSGTITSSIFDTGQSSDFNQLTYSATTSATATISIKVRSSNTSDMSMARSFTDCSPISSGGDLASGGCISNGERYLQYQATLSSTDGLTSPTLLSLSIGYTPQVQGTQSVSSTPVTVSVNSPPVCTDLVPIGSPDLFQIDMKNTDATVYFVPLTGVSKYYLSYSTSSNAEGNGLEMTLGDQGVQKISVNHLSPNVTYYFKVRGQNGCMPGNWSNIKVAHSPGEITQISKTIDSTVNQVKEALVPDKKISIISQVQTHQESAVCIHKVSPGESLWSVAQSKLSDGKRYLDIKKMNGLSKNELTIGQELKLPCDKTPEMAQKAEEETQQEGVKLAVLVKDPKGNPLEGVDVTIHSKTQTTKTNSKGIAQFENVEPGDHKVILAYNDYKGEQKLQVDGSLKVQSLTLQVQMNSGFSSGLVKIVLSGMIGVIVLLLVAVIVLFKKNKQK